MHELRVIDELSADLRFATRTARRHVLLSIAVVVTLAGGIGVSSGIFTLFDAAVLRPRIQTDPDSFAQVFVAASSRGRPGDGSLDELKALSAGRALRQVAGHHRYALPVAQAGDSWVPVVVATCNLFDTLRAGVPLAGRLLQAGDCDTAAPVAVIDESFWRQRFNADTAAIGAPLTINGAVVTIVGVAPMAAGAFDDARVWVPLTLRRHLRLGTPSNDERWLSIVGRLEPGTTRRQAAAESAVLLSPAARPDNAPTVLVTDGAVISDPRKPLVVPLITLVMTALSCLVLIACANIAVLLLSQADARRQEIAVRLSLGAGRGRLLRMLLTETVLLAVCAGAVSVWLAYQVPVLMFKWFAGGLPAYSLSPDWRAFLFLAATTALSGLAAGLAPAIESMRVDVLSSLNGRRALLGAVSGSLLRNTLAGVQIALSFVLLVGAGLFGMTHYRIATADPGFDAAHVLIVRSDLSAGALAGTLGAMPGVQSVAFARTGPVLAPNGLEVALDGVSPGRVDVNEVSPTYFSVLGLRVVRGRPLDDADVPCGAGLCHVVVSETFATAVAGGTGLGRVIRSARGNMEIVGVVRDLSAQQIGTPDPPIVYTPWKRDGEGYQAVVRFTGSASEFPHAVMAALRRDFPATTPDARTARWYIDAWLEEVGPLEILIFALGAAAGALAIIGVFGVVSFNVARRTREVGLRVALGARPRDIYATVLGSGVRPAATGLLGGVVLALGAAAAFGSVLRQMRFAVSAQDPVTYAAVGLLLATVVLAALIVPARRAARVEPFAALRCD